MSPRTPKQFEEIREEKRTLIMDVALEHFANEGYHAATINHIASHAGISKGLMYNYFASKEALLEAILKRSVMEIYEYFDTNRDGYLSEDEFDFFIRKVSTVLRDKRSFWRLFFQLVMQSEVREKFSVLSSDPLIKMEFFTGGDKFLLDISGAITDYFMRKRKTRGPDYDPLLDMNMFLITLKGYAITRIYIDDEEDDEKTINRIIELFK
jgi:AcrR family transcriptional regulator